MDFVIGLVVGAVFGAVGLLGASLMVAAGRADDIAEREQGVRRS